MYRVEVETIKHEFYTRNRTLLTHTALTVQSDSTDNNKLCRLLQGPDRPLLPCPRLGISFSIIIPVTIFLLLCVSLFFFSFSFSIFSNSFALCLFVFSLLCSFLSFAVRLFASLCCGSVFHSRYLSLPRPATLRSNLFFSSSTSIIFSTRNSGTIAIVYPFIDG